MALVGAISVGAICGFAGSAQQSIDAQREECSYSGASTGRALDFDPTSMLFEHAINGGQTHSGAFAGIFRREEWLKDSRDSRCIHPVTGIFHSQANMWTELRLRISRAITFVDFNPPGGKCEFPAIGHRVTRVESEVHDDLIDVAWVGKNRRQLWRKLHVERDVFADQPSQHRDGLLDNFIERDRTSLNNLLPAVSEQAGGSEPWRVPLLVRT